MRVEGELLVERIREENERLVVRDRDLRRADANHAQDVENGGGVACDEGEGTEVLQEHHTADGDDQVMGDVAPGVGGAEHVQLKMRGQWGADEEEEEEERGEECGTDQDATQNHHHADEKHGVFRHDSDVVLLLADSALQRGGVVFRLREQRHLDGLFVTTTPHSHLHTVVVSHDEGGGAALDGLVEHAERVQVEHVRLHQRRAEIGEGASRGDVFVYSVSHTHKRDEACAWRRSCPTPTASRRLGASSARRRRGEGRRSWRRRRGR